TVGVAPCRALHEHAAIGALGGDHVPGTERLAVGRGGGVDVGDVVGDGVQPLAVHGQTRARDTDRVEGHQLVLIAVRSAVNGPSAARAANWNRSTVSMLEIVSVSRLTLLPSSRVGSSERDSVAVARPSPVATERTMASSNATRRAV